MSNFAKWSFKSVVLTVLFGVVISLIVGLTQGFFLNIRAQSNICDGYEQVYESDTIKADEFVTLENACVLGDLAVFGRNISIKNTYVSGNILLFAETASIEDTEAWNLIVGARETRAQNLNLLNSVYIGANSVYFNDVFTRGNLYIGAQNVIGRKINTNNTYIGAARVELTGTVRGNLKVSVSDTKLLDINNLTVSGEKDIKVQTPKREQVARDKLKNIVNAIVKAFAVSFVALIIWGTAKGRIIFLEHNKKEMGETLKRDFIVGLVIALGFSGFAVFSFVASLGFTFLMGLFFGLMFLTIAALLLSTYFVPIYLANWIRFYIKEVDYRLLLILAYPTFVLLIKLLPFGGIIWLVLYLLTLGRIMRRVKAFAS